MRLSRPILYSALWSCIAHSIALGFAAAVVVSPVQPAAQPLRVSLVQRAVPLPVSDNAAGGKPEPAPVEKPAPVPIPQKQPQSKLTAKPRLPRPEVRKKVREVPQPVKTPEPPVEVTRQPQPQTPPLQVAAINPADAASSGANDATPALGQPTDEKAGKPGNDVHGARGSGGSRGVSAYPDYGVNPKPPYPMLARRLGAQGVVLLRIQVREDGSVAAVELARSSGFTMLDDSATRTVRESWRFVPARIDGAPVASWVEVPIRFILEDS